jgi:hypothetical protein
MMLLTVDRARPDEPTYGKVSSGVTHIRPTFSPAGVAPPKMIC